MDKTAAAPVEQFVSLIDAIATDKIGASLACKIVGLGPSVEVNSIIGALGPSVGDDADASTLSELGPSVGDDVSVSDVRLKHDVRCIGTTVFGLPLYRFKYIGRPETLEGVMAHEVLRVMPNAVSLAEDGYYRVNYGALGISMRQVS